MYMRAAPDAEPELDIGLDDIGVDGGEHDMRCHAGIAEGLVDAAASGHAVFVGDDGVARDVLQGGTREVEQGVAGGHDDAVGHRPQRERRHRRMVQGAVVEARVELAVPQRGEKAELVENATRNARPNRRAKSIDAICRS